MSNQGETVSYRNVRCNFTAKGIICIDNNGVNASIKSVNSCSFLPSVEFGRAFAGWGRAAARDMALPKENAC